MDNKLNTVDITSEPEPVNKNMLIKLPKDSSGKKRKVSEDLFNSDQKNKSGKNTASKNHSNRKVKSTQMSSNIKLMDKEPNVATKINFDVYDSLCASPDSDDDWGQDEAPKLKEKRFGSFAYAQTFRDSMDLSNIQKEPSPELSPINDKRTDNFESKFTIANLFGANDNVKYEQKFNSMQKNLVNCKTGYSFENQTKTNKDQSLDSLGHNNYEFSYGFVSNTSKENEAIKNEPRGISNLFSEAKFQKNTQDAEKNEPKGICDLFYEAKFPKNTQDAEKNEPKSIYDLYSGARLPKQNEAVKNEPTSIYDLYSEARLPNNTQDTKPPNGDNLSISDLFATCQTVQKPTKENSSKGDSFIIKKINFNESKNNMSSENFNQHSMSFGDLNSLNSSVVDSKNSIQNANTNLFDSNFPIELPLKRHQSFDNRFLHKIDFSKNQAPQTFQINNSEFLKKRSIESEDSITNLLVNKKKFEPQLRKNFSFNAVTDKDRINSEIKPKIQNKNIEITSSLLFSNNFESTNDKMTVENKSISFTFNGKSGHVSDKSKSGHMSPLSRTDDKCNKNVAVNTLRKEGYMECESTSFCDNNLTASHIFSITSPKNGPDSNFKSFFDSKPNTGGKKDEFESVSEKTISNPFMSSQKTVNCKDFFKGSEKKAVVGQHQINFHETKVLNLFNQPENFTKYSFNMGSRKNTSSISEFHQSPTDKKNSFSDGKLLSPSTPEKKLDPKQFYFDKTYLNTLMYDAKFNETAASTSTVRTSEFDFSMRANPNSNINSNLILSEKFIFDTKDVTKSYKPNYVILLQKMKQEYLNCFQNKSNACFKNGISVKTRLDILVEMSAICEDLYFKRETFYVSVNIFDRCQIKNPDITKSEIRTLAIMSQYVGCKLKNERNSRISIFQNLLAKNMSNGACMQYENNDLQNFEILVCQTIDWELDLPTLNSFAQILTSQWDQFINEYDTISKFKSLNISKSYDCQLSDEEANMLFSARNLVQEKQYYFRKVKLTSFRLFREFYQILDMILLLHTNHFAFNPISLVLSVMHAIIDRQFNQSDVISFGRGSFDNSKFDKNQNQNLARNQQSTSPLMQYHKQAITSLNKDTPEKINTKDLMDDHKQDQQSEESIKEDYYCEQTQFTSIFNFQQNKKTTSFNDVKKEKVFFKFDHIQMLTKNDQPMKRTFSMEFGKQDLGKNSSENTMLQNDNIDLSQSENMSFGSKHSDEVKNKNAEVQELFKFFIRICLKEKVEPFKKSHKFVENYQNFVDEYDYKDSKVMSAAKEQKRELNYENMIMHHKHSTSLFAGDKKGH